MKEKERYICERGLMFHGKVKFEMIIQFQFDSPCNGVKDYYSECFLNDKYEVCWRTPFCVLGTTRKVIWGQKQQ